MKKSFFKRIVPLLVAVILLVAALPLTASAAPTVQVSNIAYNVSIGGANAYMCNLKPIEGNVGDTMYITYTVQSASFAKNEDGTDKMSGQQQAVVGTDEPGIMWPYTSGGFMYYKNNDNNNLTKVGCTYFMKFTVTENGFDYVVGCAEGENSVYKKLTLKAGDGTDKMKYFGLYLDGGSPSVKLTNVHIYDKSGKDLGIGGRNATGLRAYSKPVEKAKNINHTYTVVADNAYDVYIRNKIKNTTDKMFIEFTCVEHSVPEGEKDFYQTGIHLNSYDANMTVSQYRYTNKLKNGQLATPERSDLLVPGASYILMLENTGVESKGWDVTIQRTVDGKTEWLKFGSMIGTPSAGNNGYSRLKFGESHLYRGSFKLTDLKIYDANYKHLGAVITGSGSVISSHEGELLSYESCDSLYYNKENKTFIAVYPDQTIDITKDGKTSSGTYSIADVTPAVMTAKVNGEELKYSFSRTRLIDSNEVVYKALGNYTLSFVTGTKTEISSQSFNSENGYKPTKPEDPKLKGDKFLGWVTADGKEFDFNTTVTESVTLYANWEKAGKAYDKMSVAAESVDYTPQIAIGLAVLILVVAVVAAVIIIVKLKVKK